MAYINKGDLLEVNGKRGVAASADYTRLVFDSYDLDMGSRWKGYEGGSAVGYVDVLFPDTGSTCMTRLSSVKKISPVQTSTST